METCVGCGSPLAPTWKYCIHCGLAVDSAEIPGAIRPAAAPRSVASSRALLFGGIGVFVVGIALLVIAIALFAGAFG